MRNRTTSRKAIGVPRWMLACRIGVDKRKEGKQGRTADGFTPIFAARMLGTCQVCCRDRTHLCRADGQLKSKRTCLIYWEKTHSRNWRDGNTNWWRWSLRASATYFRRASI